MIESSSASHIDSVGEMDCRVRQIGELQDVTAVIEAMVRDANHLADLVDRFLEAWMQESGFKSLSFPAEFLLELSAVIRIARWQRAELTFEFSSEFRPWRDLLHDLLIRLFDDRSSFSSGEEPCPAPLARRVGWLWLRYCAWGAPSTLGTDVILQAGDDEQLLDALADILWKHRHLGKSSELRSL